MFLKHIQLSPSFPKSALTMMTVVLAQQKHEVVSTSIRRIYDAGEVV